MERFRNQYGGIVAVLFAMLLTACGAVMVDLPMDLAEQIKASGWQAPKYSAGLLLVMKEDDAGLRYLASVNDLKLQLDIGEAYKKNLLDVTDLMFADVEHVRSVNDRKKAGKNGAYALEASFQLVRVTLPVTRFGKTQAHVAIRYTLYDPQRRKAFTYTDYAFGSRSNTATLGEGLMAGAFPLVGVFFQGEKDVASNAMEYNMKSSISTIAGLIQQYMDEKTRTEALAVVAAHERETDKSVAAYARRIRNGDHQEKSIAAVELRKELGALALVQNELEEELMKFAKQGLKGDDAAQAARDMCETLAMTGNKKHLKTLQYISQHAKDDGLRRWSGKAREDLLYSLCGTKACDDKKQARAGR